MCGDIVDSDDVAASHCSKQVPSIVEAAQIALLHHELRYQLQIRSAQQAQCVVLMILVLLQVDQR